MPSSTPDFFAAEGVLPRKARSFLPSASPSNAFVQALLDCAWDLFAVMRVDGRIRYLSPSNERLLGYEIDDLVGQNGFDLLHPDDRPLLDDAFEQLHRDPDEPVTLKHRFRAADGAWRTLESTLQNKLAHPVLCGWVVHSRDVTDRDTLHAELDRTRQALRRLQLHPHFVLNVLHTIQSQVLADPEAAAETIAHFGDLLRLSYAHVDTPMVPLGHEVDFVERYVDLYRHRFGTPITATFDVPDSLRATPVPSLLLQPLVENALLHGLRPAQGGRLTVRARDRDGHLCLTVLDDGVGLQDDENECDEQVGLATTRTRLRQVYGAGTSLRISGVAEEGTIVTIVLPLDGQPAAEDPQPPFPPPDRQAQST